MRLYVGFFRQRQDRKAPSPLGGCVRISVFVAADFQSAGGIERRVVGSPAFGGGRDRKNAETLP
jgi:hypothetical protein